MTFQEYCASKKIDALAFQKEDQDYFNELETLFNEVSPASFTQQKKFIINQIRRTYQLKTVEVPKQKTTTKKAGVKIPGIKPKPATTVSNTSSAKPKIPGVKPVIKSKVGGSPKPVIKPKTESSAKPVVKPKIPGVNKSSTPKPKIPGVKKPVIKPTSSSEGKTKSTSVLKPKIPISKPKETKTEETLKPKVLKPKIPGAKKPSPLKPKIPKK